MKLSFVAAACVATGVAADAEPPVITLNFDAKSDYAKIMKLKNSVIRGHDLGYKNNGKQVGSRQDWVERCPAGRSNAQSCPFPKASAFDHNDGKVRHLEGELKDLKEFKDHHPGDNHDPTSLEMYCENNPEAPECRVYDD